MKVKRIEMVGAMKRVCMNVSGKGSLPIFEQAIFSCIGDKLKISNINAVSEICVEIPVEEGKDEMFTLNAKMFSGMMEKLKSDVVDMDIIQGGVKISNSKFEATCESFSKEDMPESKIAFLESSSDKTTPFVIKTEVFLNLLKTASASCAVENFNVTLQSMLLSVKSNKITSVGTDGKRMSVMDVIGEYTDMPDVVLPNYYNAIKAMFSDVKDLTVDLMQDKIRIRGDNTIYVLSVINATYPNYMKVVPDVKDWKTLKVSLESLDNAVNIVTIKDTATKDIIFDVVNKKMTIEKNDAGKKISSYSLDVEYDGEPIRMSLNSDYIKNLCKIYDKEDVLMRFESNSKPVVFEDEGFKYIVMPLRITEKKS